MVEKFVKMWYNTFACERQIGICEGGIYCEYRVLVMWSFGVSDEYDYVHDLQGTSN